MQFAGTSLEWGTNNVLEGGRGGHNWKTPSGWHASKLKLDGLLAYSTPSQLLGMPFISAPPLHSSSCFSFQGVFEDQQSLHDLCSPYRCPNIWSTSTVPTFWPFNEHLLLMILSSKGLWQRELAAIQNLMNGSHWSLGWGMSTDSKKRHSHFCNQAFYYKLSTKALT